MSPNESYPQHVVTAVIVAHDGVTWLPQVADAVLGQTRPVQRVVAVDTGSRDRSGAVLASKFGQAAVFGMERPTGYGAAIARALQHRAARTPVPPPQGSQGSERTEWLWLLHDDCEPAPDALEQLLRGTVETTSAAVLGPKVRDWTNRDVILEAGVTLDTAARRVTGIEPREVDQGQHDGDRDALGVSSAGMLVRRDVWEQVGGFDAAMSLFMEDIDFCWRVHAAGYRVRVITDAVVYHVQAAAKRRRAVSTGRRPGMLERRNGLLTLLGNLPASHALAAAVGNVMIALWRILFFLLAKRVAAATDELRALISVLCHPIRLVKMRMRRASGRRAAFSRVRADLPPGHSVRRLAEFAVSMLSSSQADRAGSHHATDDPAEDDSMLVDNGLGRRLLTSPTLFTFVVLTGISLAACWSLIGPGPLGGGSLVPAWGGSGSLWASYIQTFHPSGIGSTTPAPPWLAVIAALATVLGGKPWLAIDVILIGCVPLSGMTAMFAVRKITSSGLVRVWASMTYALLPIAMGVIAAGRFGSAVAFVLLPLIVAQAGRMITQTGPRATRAAWATGLLTAIGSAFVPLVWVIVLLACVFAAVGVRSARRGLLRKLAIAALTAPVLLMPWTLTAVSNPSGLLLEAGVPQSGAPAFSLPARSLLLLSPGGPGLPPFWVTGGLLVAAFAALFAGRRRRMVVAGWGLALCGLLAAVVASHLIVRPADTGPVTIWPGVPLALAAAGLLIAVASAADGLGRQPDGTTGWRPRISARSPWAALLGLVACTAPVLAAAYWLTSGVSGPVHQVASPVVPQLVVVADGQGRQVRTLVLRSAGGRISYLLLRGSSPSLADVALSPPADAQAALSKAVSALTTPGGNLAAAQAQVLAQFDIGFVMVQAPVDPQLATALNDVSGLQLYSSNAGHYSLWKLTSPPARVAVREQGGTVVPVTSGATSVTGVPAPAAGGTLMLAEPAGGWKASVNGHALAAVPSPAGSWAQAFRLPRGGGTLTVEHPGMTRELLLILELLALLVVAALALPGLHVAEDAAVVAAAAQDKPAGRASRRVDERASGGIPAQRTAASAGTARAAATVSGAAGAGHLGTDPASATTAVMDPATRQDAGLAAAGLAAAGLAGAGLAASGTDSRGAGGRRPQAGDADDSGAEEQAGRRRLSRAGRGRSQQEGRDPAGRNARDRLADWQRAGLSRVSRAAPSAREGQSPDEDRQDAQTTAMAADSGAGGWPAQGRSGRRAGGMVRGSRRTGDRPDEPRGERNDGRLADAWPYDTGEQERGAGVPRHSGQHSYPRPGDAGGEVDPAGRSGRHGFEGRQDRSTGERGRHGYRTDEGVAASSARSGTGWRSPSGRSPGGDWPYQEQDLPAGRDGARDDSWPAQSSPSGGPAARPSQAAQHDAPSGRTRRGERAYRLTGPRRVGGPAPGSDLEPDSETPTGDKSAGEQDTGGRAGRRRGRRGGGRHGAGRSADRPVPEPGEPRDTGGWRSGDRPGRETGDPNAGPASWHGAGGDELQPLPPRNGSGRGGGPRHGEDSGDWGRFDDQSGDQQWRSRPADYEPEYRGDSW